ncbi:MAG: co-chaperone GroES [Ezakiella sp.]|nr:co-chaperone GroES [Bacillota bacterium]MDY3947606.1 co-chaperone GroES [Ezakiella sp.]
MIIKPLGDRLLIEKQEAEEKTQSGIVLPQSAKEQPSIAVVVAVSEEITKDEKKKDLVKVGDKVVFSKYSGTEIKLDGKEYLIVKWMDVLAVLA